MSARSPPFDRTCRTDHRFPSARYYSTGDWSLGEGGGTTPKAIQSNFQKWLAGKH